MANAVVRRVPSSALEPRRIASRRARNSRSAIPRRAGRVMVEWVGAPAVRGQCPRRAPIMMEQRLSGLHIRVVRARTSAHVRTIRPSRARIAVVRPTAQARLRRRRPRAVARSAMMATFARTMIALPGPVRRPIIATPKIVIPAPGEPSGRGFVLRVRGPARQALWAHAPAT